MKNLRIIMIFQLSFALTYFFDLIFPFAGLLVDGDQVLNSTTNEGTNSRCQFDDNISRVDSRDPPLTVSEQNLLPLSLSPGLGLTPLPRLCW